MVQEQRKRYGPITLFCESRRVQIVVLLNALLPVLYVAAYGPLAILYNRGLLPSWLMAVTESLHWPLTWLYANGAKPVADAVVWFSNLWR